MNSEETQQGKHFISKGVDSFFLNIHHIATFILRFFKEVFRKPVEFAEITRQCYEVGYKSLALITVTGFITGLVLPNSRAHRWPILVLPPGCPRWFL